jgi:hypothetical protein
VRLPVIVYFTLTNLAFFPVFVVIFRKLLSCFIYYDVLFRTVRKFICFVAVRSCSSTTKVLVSSPYLLRCYSRVYSGWRHDSYRPKVDGLVLHWFETYLIGCRQHVRFGSLASYPLLLPQFRSSGHVWRPISSLIYDFSVPAQWRHFGHYNRFCYYYYYYYYLRTTMAQNRLTGLTLLYLNKDIPISTDEVIDFFARKSSRRLEFVLH